MKISMHFVNGHTIISAFSIKGKWKIPTKPGFARYFNLLSDAKKWAKKNPVDIVKTSIESQA
jgi:hypothetical protein